jgi:peptide/nickel transport system permease protein
VSHAVEAVRERGPVATSASRPGWLWMRALLRRKITLVGAILVALNVLVALAASTLGRADPQFLDVKARLSSPSAAHWFGTDDVGRDVWSRVIHGTRLSMVVGGSVVLFSFAAGLLFGLLGGYYPALDNVLMRIMDGLMAFPGIILAIALMASLGPSLLNVIVALGIVYVPRVARIVRGSVLVIRETPYVEAARALGVPDLIVLGRHVLPNCVSPVIVQGTFIFAAAVLGEAALSFLGVGVPLRFRHGGMCWRRGGSTCSRRRGSRCSRAPPSWRASSASICSATVSETFSIPSCEACGAEAARSDHTTDRMSEDFRSAPSDAGRAGSSPKKPAPLARQRTSGHSTRPSWPAEAELEIRRLSIMQARKPWIRTYQISPMLRCRRFAARRPGPLSPRT